MGQVFGRTGVAEPAFEVVYQHTKDFTYEVRRYGERFAAQATYGPGSENDDNTPFMLLAKYIGVFGTPENEGEVKLQMTAPVVKESKTKEGEKISMTAPVIKSKEGEDGIKTMDFILPAKYDSISKIPKPTNPGVTIKEVPPAVGVVHQYSGSMEDEHAIEMAKQLAKQLQQDGLSQMTEDYVLDKYQFWGYNPPFTIPMFRRNEIWVEIDEEQLSILINGGVTTTDVN